MEAETLKYDGNDLFKEKKFQEARDRYEAAIKLCANENETWKACKLNIAQASIKLEDYEAADHAASDVLKLDSTNVKALYRRGLARSRLRQYS